MENELTIKDEAVISVVKQNELSDIIKPLIREIYLFDSYIAGTTHLEDPSVLDKLKIGDRLDLMRENNKFDSYAIMIINGEKKKLGYVPEKDNLVFARLMDAGKLLKAKVSNLEMIGSFHKISVEIYLVDL